MLFPKDSYVQRRAELMRRVGHGLILLPGHVDSPANYPNNAYRFRQDSSFLYYFGQHREGLCGLLDVDNQEEWLLGDDIGIDDIIWYGSVSSVADMAQESGVGHSAPMAKLKQLVDLAVKQGRKVHYLPPYRGETKIQLQDLLGIHPAEQKAKASLELIRAVIDQRAVKTKEEIAEIERACAIGYEMHTTAMKLCRPGVSEQYIAGVVDGISHSYGCMPSFQTILSMHGEIMHGTPSTRLLEAGRLMLCDAGAETNENYCSDNTRTTPISGRYTQKQAEIYDIVSDCHDHAREIARPDIAWRDVHLSVCRLMIERLKELGLMRGDTDEALAAGAHALFLPHGLGHMMGLDVHDMEGLGQEYVGFDDEVRPSEQFGLDALRCGRRLQEGFVMTDEPGIYFIPTLIDDWQARKHNAEFLCFDKINEYRDFGGIRIENDLLITKGGCRFLGEKMIPYHRRDVEDYLQGIAGISGNNSPGNRGNLGNF